MNSCQSQCLSSASEADLKPNDVARLRDGLGDERMLLFNEEQRCLLAERKQRLQYILAEVDPQDEETSYHELMLWATAKAVFELPQWKANIYLAKLDSKATYTLFARELGVCRQTITKLIECTAREIKAKADAYIKRYQIYDI